MKKNLENSIKKWFFFLVCIMTFTYVSSYLLVVLPALKKTNKEKYKGDINKLFSTTSQEFDYFSSVLKANSQWDTLYEIMDGTTSDEDKEKFFYRRFFKGF